MQVCFPDGLHYGIESLRAPRTQNRIVSTRSRAIEAILAGIPYSLVSTFSH